MRRETVWRVTIFLVFLSTFDLSMVSGHAETEPFYVQASRARVRATPVIEPGNILDTFERGTDVAVLGQAGDWFEVQLPNGRSFSSVGPCSASITRSTLPAIVGRAFQCWGQYTEKYTRRYDVPLKGRIFFFACKFT